MRCVASLASIHPPGPAVSLSHLGHGYFAYIVWSNVAGHHKWKFAIINLERDK
jgi:hypothetical protein